MAGNPYFIQPASPLQALMSGVEGWEGAQKRTKEADMMAGRQRAMQTLQSGGDLRGPMAELMGIGDTKAMEAIAAYARQQAQGEHEKAQLAETTRFHTGSLGIQQGQLAQTARHQADTLGVQKGTLDLARQTFERKEDPEKVRVIRAAGIDPNSPEGRQALFRLDEKLGTADKKAIFDAEDDTAKLENTVTALTRAKELNPKIFTGLTASLRGTAGTSGVPGANLIFDKGASDATAEWNQIMSGEAIKNMSETLKGASTDFEMNKFIGIIADTSKPPQVREAAINRVMALAERKREINKTRMEQLRSGTYYKPGGGAVGAAPAAAPAAPSGRPPPPPGFILNE